MTPDQLAKSLSDLDLWDTQKAADWLGVSRRAVQRYVTTGPVPGPVARCIVMAAAVRGLKRVDVRIDDATGNVSVEPIKDGRLWFTPDGGMYVYYTPTHWSPAQ